MTRPRMHPPQNTRRHAAFRLLAGLALALGLIAAPIGITDAQAATPLPFPRPIAPETRRDLQARGRADVIITLISPATLPAKPATATATATASGATPSAPPARVAIARVQATLLGRLKLLKGWKARHALATLPVLAGEATRVTLKALATMPEVATIEPDWPVRGALAESARAIGAIHARQQFNCTGAGVVVGLIDTGIDLTHPDLAGALVAGRRILGTTQNDNVQDDNGHGTHLAGIITGDGGHNIAPPGIAPASRLVVIKALDQYMTGNLSDVIAGIDWIIAWNIDWKIAHPDLPALKWINLSLVIPGSRLPTHCPCDDQPDTLQYNLTAFKLAIQRALAEDIRLIMPAGNDGETNGLRAPACLSGIVSVGATFDAAYDRAPASGDYSSFGSGFAALYDAHPETNTLAGFSNRAPGLDLFFLAPGYNITSCWLGSTTKTTFGTSMATAHVTGVLALMQSRATQRPGALLLQKLIQTATLTPDPDLRVSRQTHYRRIDALAALQAAINNNSLGWEDYR